MAEERRPVWHPCDAFLDPLIGKLKRLISVDSDTDDARFDTVLNDILRLTASCEADMTRSWLELNLRPTDAERVISRIEAFVDSVRDWDTMRAEWRQWLESDDAQTEYLIRNRRSQNGQGRKSDPGMWTEVPREAYVDGLGKQIAATFNHLLNDAADLLGQLYALSTKIRGSVCGGPKVPDNWKPNDFQKTVLRKLAGKSLSAHGLMTQLCIGSKETLYGKAKKGGLSELQEKGLVVNDRRKGGYLRPDLPPA